MDPAPLAKVELPGPKQPVAVDYGRTDYELFVRSLPGIANDACEDAPCWLVQGMLLCVVEGFEVWGSLTGPGRIKNASKWENLFEGYAGWFRGLGESRGKPKHNPNGSGFCSALRGPRLW